MEERESEFALPLLHAVGERVGVRGKDLEKTYAPAFSHLF
jgi:hypothetical protein